MKHKVEGDGTNKSKKGGEPPEPQTRICFCSFNWSMDAKDKPTTMHAPPVTLLILKSLCLLFLILIVRVCVVWALGARTTGWTSRESCAIIIKQQAASSKYCKHSRIAAVAHRDTNTAQA